LSFVRAEDAGGLFRQAVIFGLGRVGRREGGGHYGGV